MLRQLWKLSDLCGYRLHARDGEIGRLQEIFFDDRDWAIQYFVVLTGAWLGREVLLLPSQISGIDEDDHGLRVDLTRAQIGKAPKVDTSLPISRHDEQAFFGYYGINPYWWDDPLGADRVGLRSAPAEAQPREPDQPHLRSSKAVAGYRIHASDGEIGHVEDFIIGDRNWNLRYLEIDTREWLPGKHVLLAPIWVHAFDWRNREVTVNLSRETIESAPAYDRNKVISNEYEVALYKHYGMELESE